MLSLPWVLFEHAEPQIGSGLRLEDPPSFQCHVLIDERLEKAKTFTKENRDNTHMDLVNQSGSEALLSGLRAAYHHDVFVPAAALACSIALWMPSVTKVTVNWSFSPSGPFVGR